MVVPNVFVILDGATGVGKSSLLQHLVDDQSKVWETPEGNKYGDCLSNVDDMVFKTRIYESNVNLGNLYDEIKRSHYLPGIIIIEIFAINEPRTLEEIMNFRIPCIRSRCSWVPILLVGTKSDLRKDNNPSTSDLQSLVPLATAMNYVECSVISGQGVYEVLEEAVRATVLFEVSNKLKHVLPVAPINAVYEMENLYSFLDKNLDEMVVQLYNLTSLEYGKPGCRWWCMDELKYQLYHDIRYLRRDDLVCRKGPISLRFVKQDFSAIEECILSCAPITVRSLVILSCTGKLSFKFLSALEGLECLVIANTKVDFTSLNFPPKLILSLKYLVLRRCVSQTAEVPPAIGKLTNLQYLDVTCNRFTKLPLTLGGLDKLNTLEFDRSNMIFPLRPVVNKSTQDIIQYLKAIPEGSVENVDFKLMIVGQEDVGKSTLVKSLKQSYLSQLLWNTTPPNKTYAVDVSVLQLPETNCTVYDLAGDVEYLNTHSLFFSPNCLHLAVFNLSQFAVCKDIRSNDHFCRLELWLQTIACQDPHSYAIIVGTHVDLSMLSEEMRHRIRTLLVEILSKYLSQHRDSVQFYEECLLCNPDKLSSQDASAPDEFKVLRDNSPGINSNSSSIPHILGYYEVSGITNNNIKNLKSKVDSSIADIKNYTETSKMPKAWLLFRKSVATRLSQDKDLKRQPILQLSYVHDLAYEAAGLTSQQSFVAMLRFFHSQGDFLWYEDIPEMKDVVILDPQWLSDQLRTLISHRSSEDAICEGVLHHSEQRKVWVDMAEENRSKLINLFRSVSLCISVSEMEDLFPCKLPVGWPDREMWPPLPNQNENQTSLLFLFSFVPSSFFPDLIVVINKKRAFFAPNVQPLYYRFNVVYITQEQCMCCFHQQEYVKRSNVGGNDDNNGQQVPPSHRIHLELMPYNNSLKVTVRGPNPCCMVPGIRSVIRDVKSRRCRGVTYKERVVCPECELKKVHNPSSFEFDDSHGGFCPKGHNAGKMEDILAGKLSSSIVVPSVVGQTGRIVGETLEDNVCPKLFAVLPINLESLSLMDRFVYSYVRDGYAVHLLCECPGEWHFVTSPGFRVGKPKEFFEKYGSRVCKVLRVISALGAPFKIASAFEPHCKAAAAATDVAETARESLHSLLENYLDEYPHLRASLGSPNDDLKDLKDLKSSRGLHRSELSQLLEIKATGRVFGPLACTYVDKFNEWLWLCEEHNQKYEIVER